MSFDLVCKICVASRKCKVPNGLRYTPSGYGWGEQSLETENCHRSEITPKNAQIGRVSFQRKHLSQKQSGWDRPAQAHRRWASQPSGSFRLLLNCQAIQIRIHGKSRCLPGCTPRQRPEEGRASIPEGGCVRYLLD